MAATNPTPCLTPAGRIVWGHPTKVKPKLDVNTRAPVLNKDGQQVMVASFGLAIEKPQFLAVVWPAMQVEIAKGFPSGPPHPFSYKFTDGDAMDKQDKPYSDREGYRGCYILNISTEITPPQLVRLNGNQYMQMGIDDVKTGDYVRAQLNFQINIPTVRTHTPGLYVNPSLIEFLGYGTAIFNGPDAMQVFGGAPVALPVGASMTPVASTGAIGAAPGGMPQPLALPAPAGMVQPAPFVPAAVPQQAIPAGYQPTQPLGQTAYLSNGVPAGMPQPLALPAPVAAVQPAHDFVAAATGQMPGQPPAMPTTQPAPTAVTYDPQTGQPINAAPRVVGYNPQTGQPIYG